MDDFRRCLTFDMPFEEGLVAVASALNRAGFEVIAVDVCEELRQVVNHNFAHYLLLIVSSLQKRHDGVSEDPADDTIEPATVAVYELGDGGTAVVAAEPFKAGSRNHKLEDACPELLASVRIETERRARAMDTLSHQRFTEVLCRRRRRRQEMNITSH
jgi:uncharacterized protein (DUF302 family)